MCFIQVGDLEKVKLKVFKVLYICEKLNICLLFEKTYSPNEIEELELFNKDSFIEDVLLNLKYYKMELMNGAINLSTKLPNNIHFSQNIENNEDFKILHIEDIDNFIDEINPHTNIAFGKDVYGVSRFQMTNKTNSYEVKRVLNKYSKEDNLDDLKNLLKNNSYGFVPFILYKDNDIEIFPIEAKTRDIYKSMHISVLKYAGVKNVG